MVIGLLGRAYSGKTTASKILTTEFNCNRIAFADALKTMLIEAGMCTYDEVYINKTDQSRWLMQKVGTEIFRKQIDPEFWVKRTKASVQKVLDKGQRVVIDDIRFPNEAQTIKDLGGVVIKIVREGYIDTKTDTTHDSEKLVDEISYDFIISVPTGIELLQDETRKIAKIIFG